jgi:hypothetical protein
MGCDSSEGFSYSSVVSADRTCWFSVRRNLTALRTSFTVGGKTGAGSGTLGSFGCAGSAMGGGLGGEGEGPPFLDSKKIKSAWQIQCGGV